MHIDQQFLGLRFTVYIQCFVQSYMCVFCFPLYCSLIKMLYCLVSSNTPCQLTTGQLRHAVLRNFGGIDKLRPFDFFEKFIGKHKLVDAEVCQHLCTICMWFKFCRVTLHISLMMVFNLWKMHLHLILSIYIYIYKECPLNSHTVAMYICHFPIYTIIPFI